MYFIEPLYGKETIVSKTKARMVKPKPIKNVKRKDYDCCRAWIQ